MSTMITIITGEKDTGKSSFLKKWYESVPRGVGFYSRKVFCHTRLIGYDLVFLPGMQTFPLIRLPEWTAAGEPGVESIRKGRFSFSPAGFRLARQWIEAYAIPGEPVWMDEVGGLELAGGGFDGLIREVLLAHEDVRMVFRKHLLEKLVAHYVIEKYRVIRF